MISEMLLVLTPRIRLGLMSYNGLPISEHLPIRPASFCCDLETGAREGKQAAETTILVLSGQDGGTPGFEAWTTFRNC